MADIIFAGEPGEKFGGLEAVMSRHGEPCGRVEMEMTDPEFLEKAEKAECCVIISRFHEGDLASIKAMQLVRMKKPCVKFIFITAEELTAPILTLMFNEGAYGILREPVSAEGAAQLVRQAIKKSRWEMDEAALNRDLRHTNEALNTKVERLELELSRARDLTDRLERLSYFLFSDRQFKPKTVKILLISDSAYQRNAMEGLFGGMGFTVTAAGSAEEAIPRIKSEKPHIVVSDLELPGMSGVDMAKEVKGQKGYPPVYFVILTANEDKVDYILSPETKVDDCVIKPGDTEKFYGVATKVALGILTL
ncbi:MAG: response regulator [Nitrospinae bacterium]|nr:response regulator [Nitrospinota bacterium]